MSKIDAYRQALRALTEWEPYLWAESGLPGPRGNLELAQAVADVGSEAQFQHFLDADAYGTPPQAEYLIFCGLVGYGRLVGEGRRDLLPTLRRFASDGRWRMREAVAMGLQRWGAHDMPALLREMADWGVGNYLEMRAAAAAVCEPALLRAPAHAGAVFDLLDEITVALERGGERKSDAYQALRKGMAYCWSVAVAAYVEPGKARLERWLESADKDVRWMMKENLKKRRLERLAPDWTAACLSRLNG